MADYDIGRDARGIYLFSQWGGKYSSTETPEGSFANPSSHPGSAGRIYWQLYDGVNTTDCIRLLELELRMGGWWAWGESWLQFSVYGRRTLDGKNRCCVYRQVIRRFGAEDDPHDWHHVPPLSLYFDKDEEVRCIVGRIEALGTFAEQPITSIPAKTRRYWDQIGIQSPPPHGVIVKKARVFGKAPVHYRSGKAVIYVTDAIKDIIAPKFKAKGLKGTLAVDQLYFKELPKTERDALEEANAMLGRDYFAWSDDEITFQGHDAGRVRRLDITDPRVTFGLSDDVDQTRSRVLVQFTNRLGKPREVLVKGNAPVLRGQVRSTTISAPDSVKTLRGARLYGKRYLRDRKKLTQSNTVTVRGVIPGFGDALLVRPGERVTLVGAKGATKRMRITTVRPRPLDWESELSFDIEPWRLDRWLAAHAAQGHTVRL